jgi:aminopeptidase YwaD
MRRTMCTAGMVLALVTACDSADRPQQAPASPSARSSPAGPVPSPSPAASSSSAAPPSSAQSFRAPAAQSTVDLLAGEIGPRQATSPSYRRAATWVEGQLTGLGYDVTRQSLRAPKGVSWGLPVPGGRTWNVVARPAGMREDRPYLVVGAHLDTVPQAPGAEDNASGVAVVLELARLAAAAETRLPVVFVAFAAEEPRGSGDGGHHFGSTAMVSRLSGDERRSLRGMVSLDRVGVGRAVPICTGGLGSPGVQRELVRAARRVDVATRSCHDNRASDHWSFEKAGLPAARLGSTPYPQYHSAADRPGVVNPAQLRRVGRVMWAWLSA